MQRFLTYVFSAFLLGIASCRADSGRLLLSQLQDQIGEDAITFPVFHRDLGYGEYKKPPGRRTLESQNSSSSQPTDLKSPLVTLNESFGQYFAALELGTPPTPVAVIIDTGSELLWIQCEPCVECGVQASGYPIFEPNKSSSFLPVECGSQSCPVDESVATACEESSSLCSYHVTYGDHSNSSGYLSLDTLTVPTAKGSSYKQKNLVFGCGFINNGVESQLNASGLLGLDRGIFSLISQLGVTVFSYCLPNRIQTTKVSGYLTLGKSSLSGPNLQYTPMIQNNASDFLSQFYYLNLTGVSINGKLLDIPSNVFEITTSGNAGTIIDSGTTLTSFVDEAYTIIADAFSGAMDSSVTRADAGDTGLLCYQVPLNQKQAPAAPKVTLHFANSLDLQLDTDHVFRFIGSDTTLNYYCMAFNNAGSLNDGGKNFIGNYQQQNFLVEYDIAKSRVGFAATICNHGSSLNNVEWLSLSHLLLWVIPTFLMFIL